MTHGDTMPQHIALIGLSGTGKSTLAHLLAKRLGWLCADTDAQIVAQTGRSAAAIFAAEGEAFFRDLETAVLREVFQIHTNHPVVLATGGGIVLRPENRLLLSTHTHVIWLDASTDTLLARLHTHSEQRPLLAGDDPRGRIEALRTTRAPLYQSLAAYAIDTSEMDLQRVADRVLASIPDLKRGDGR